MKRRDLVRTDDASKTVFSSALIHQSLYGMDEILLSTLMTGGSKVGNGAEGAKELFPVYRFRGNWLNNN